MSTERKVKGRDTSTFLARNPVFTLDGFASEVGLTRTRALERVKYHMKRKRVVTLERGLYATVPLGVAHEGFQPDRYLVAATVRPDAIFSYHAALELLGVAHSDWSVCTAFTGRRRRELRLNSTELRFLTHPTPLVRRGAEQLGTRQVEHQSKLLRVTGPERTLVEGFRQPHAVGGLAELVESAAGFGVLDLDLLEKVLLAYNQRSLWSGTGWFLERFRETFFVSDDVLHRFEAHRPRSPQYLPRSLDSGVFISRWNILLPEKVVRGGEPDELE